MKVELKLKLDEERLEQLERLRLELEQAKEHNDEAIKLEQLELERLQLETLKLEQESKYHKIAGES